LWPHFSFCTGAFSAFKRAHRDDLPTTTRSSLLARPVNLSIEPVLRVVGVGGSLVIALLSGAAMAAQWQTLALWWYAPQGAGVA
jgi:hypothetical protein